MSLFVLFAPLFWDWPIEIVRELKRLNPSLKVTGIATGGARTHRTVLRELGDDIESCDHLSDLEEVWISKEPSESSRSRVMEYFSDWDLNAIVISDRHIGRVR